MTDNVELNAGSGGVNLATDDDGTAHHQYVKVEFGADNTQTPVSSANPMPVDNSGQTQPVSAASLPLPTGAATSAKQLADGHNVANAGTFVVQEDGAALTSLQLLDDTVKILGTDTYSEASTKANVIGAVRNDGNGPLVNTDNEIAPLQVNADGALYTHSPNKISTNNSTTATLGSSATYTGTGEDVSQYSSITIQLDSSHDSATDGMTFEFSVDNVNWDNVHLFTYTAAGGARHFQYAVTAQYFRVVYTNGGTEQTHNRIQTILHDNTVLTSIHRLVDDTNPDRSAEITKSVIIAQGGGSGDFVPVQATTAGNLKMSVQEISDGIDVGNGAVGGETQRVTIANDSTGQVIPTDGTNQISIFGSSASDGEATSPNPLNTASFSYSFNGTTWDRVRGSVADGLLVNLGSNNDVTVAGVATAANQVAKATGGMSYHMLGIAAADNDAVIKASAATVYFISMQTIDATPVYLKLFDLASFTPGASTADLQFMAPSQGDALGSGITLNFGPHGIQFSNGLCALVATGFALDDNTAVSANEVIVTIGYE